MNGLILVKKPSGCTSHDVIVSLRKILNTQRIGHFGTLDPLATGLLLVAVGRTTRLFSFFSKEDKLYRGQIRLGYSTDTYDSQGEPTSPETEELPSRKKILEAMKTFEGEFFQVPPVYSAKKYRGKPLYRLARKKEKIQAKPARVVVYYFRLKKLSPPFIDVEVKCSTGTYIRSLAHDLGQALDCGAHLSSLTRIEAGKYSLQDAHTLKEIEQLTKEGNMDDFFLPLEILLPQFPKVILKESGALSVRNGNMISPEEIYTVLYDEPERTRPAQESEAVFRLFNLGGELLALARRRGKENILHPFIVLC